MTPSSLYLEPQPGHAPINSISSSTIAALSESLWREIEVDVDKVHSKMIHIPDYDRVELFIDEAAEVSQAMINSLKKVTRDIVLCLPLHELGNAHIVWYGSGVRLQGWAIKNASEVSFYEAEIA